MLAFAPFALGFLFLPSRGLAFTSLAVAAFFMGTSTPGIHVTTQALAPARLRSLASAINLLLLSLVGAGLGPLAVGILNDVLLKLHIISEPIAWTASPDTALIAVIMVVIFFVTSADSGALVVNMLASNGEDQTPVWQRIYWTATIGVTAAVLLVAGGSSRFPRGGGTDELDLGLPLMPVFTLWRQVSGCTERPCVLRRG